MEKRRAIEVLKPLVNSFVDYANITMKEEDDNIVEALEMAVESLKAQLSQEVTAKDAISRQAAIDALNEYFSRIGKLKRRGLTKGEEAISLDTVGAIKTLPPVQPEPHYDEWCDTCKEYDHERHCCPRWNHVIRTTLQDAQPEPHEGHWIWVAGELMCSECHTIYSDLYPDYDNAVACPHCGAKMTISK